MTVCNMQSTKGNPVANQFIIFDEENSITYFQSYRTIIVKKDLQNKQVFLDENDWNYSRTTAKYRSIFLRETTKETEAKIESGEYILTNLNK